MTYEYSTSSRIQQKLATASRSPSSEQKLATASKSPHSQGVNFFFKSLFFVHWGVQLLSTPEDRAAMKAGVAQVRQLFATSPLKEMLSLDLSFGKRFDETYSRCPINCTSLP